jgi:antitoxin ParD1/3/4
MARNTSVSLGDHFTEFVQQQVASGRYATASDVLRAGLRLLEYEDAKLEQLRHLIAEGIASLEAGDVYEDSDEFWEGIDREVDERVKRRERPAHHVLP